MPERLETVLTLLISLLGAVAALLAEIRRWRGKQPAVVEADQAATLEEIEKDIVRLDALVQGQQRLLAEMATNTTRKDAR